MCCDEKPQIEMKKYIEKSLETEKKKLREKKKIETISILDPTQIDLFVDWYNKHHGNITDFRTHPMKYRKKKLREFIRGLNANDRQYKLNI